MILDRILGLFGKRDTSGYANPSQWFVDWMHGGQETSAGVRITRDVALTYAAVWRGVTKISQDVATLPLSIRVKLSKGGKDNATEHPAYYLIKYKPNDYMTSPEFRQTMQADALLCGSGYAFINRRPSGEPYELLPLSAQSTYPKLHNGEWWYETQINGEIVRMHRNNILHIKGLSPNGIEPYSVFDKARESLGIGLAARKYGATYFKNNAKPSLVLEHPGKLSPEAADKLRSAWQAKFSGDNAFTVGIAQEGMKINPLSISNTDAQFIETRKFELREIANWLGLPPHFLGDDSKTAYASLEQENQSYLDGCLNSWLVMWESQLYDKLLTEDEKRKESHTVEFTRQALVRANLQARGSFYALGINNRWLCPNEIRELENMNPYEGGDEFLVPLNMGNPGGNPDATPKGDIPEEKPSEPPKQETPKDDSARTKVVIADAVKRSVKRIAFHARNAGNKPKAFMEFIDGFRDEHRAIIIEMLQPAIGLVTTGGAAEVHERTACITSDFLDAMHGELLALSGVCKANELSARVSACMDAHEQFTIETITRSIMEPTQ